MSWGFIVDLVCTVPSDAWPGIKMQRPSSVVLDEDWSGLSSEDLRKAFAPPGKALGTFGELLEESDVSVRVTKSKGNTKVRVVALRDRSALDFAGAMAALLEVAHGAGGGGELALVNDGTYSGEDGVVLTRKAGAKRAAPKPIKNYAARLAKLEAELVPKAAKSKNPFLRTTPESPEEVEAGRVRRETAQRTREANELGRAAFALYQANDVRGARSAIERSLESGGLATPYLVRMYAILLRNDMPLESDPRARVLDIMLGACEREAALRRDSSTLQEVVAVGNENGRSEQTIEIFLRGLDEGLVPSSWLVVNVCNSAGNTQDKGLRARLVQAVLPRLVEGRPEFEQPSARISLANIHHWAGNADGVLTALAGAVAADPDLREQILADVDWEPYRGDPRWKKISG